MMEDMFHIEMSLADLDRMVDHVVENADDEELGRLCVALDPTFRGLTNATVQVLMGHILAMMMRAAPDGLPGLVLVAVVGRIALRMAEQQEDSNDG